MFEVYGDGKARVRLYLSGASLSESDSRVLASRSRLSRARDADTGARGSLCSVLVFSGTVRFY